MQQAIAYLGVRQIRNLAMTASTSKLFSSNEKIGPYSRSGLWQHLVSVGICARLLAMRLNLKNFEDIFLAGLLHDIGIVLEDQHVHDPFVAAMDSLAQGRRSAQSNEHRLVSTTRCWPKRWPRPGDFRPQ